MKKSKKNANFNWGGCLLAAIFLPFLACCGLLFIVIDVSFNTTKDFGFHAPAWSPDGSRIAYTAGLAKTGNIWVAKADGSDPVNITADVNFICSQPDWSPDGSRIVFNLISGNPLQADIWVMNADGSNKRNLTPNSSYEELTPVWSPDGTKIAYLSNASGNLDVWVMDVDGNNRRNLTAANPLTDSYPSWILGTQTIIYGADEQRGDKMVPVIRQINADGSGGRILLEPTGGGDQPQMNIHGRIAYVNLLSGNPDIWVTNPTQNLTEQSPFYEIEPAWSPDGQTLAFRSDEEGEPRIYLMDADGQNKRALRQPPQPRSFGQRFLIGASVLLLALGAAGVVLYRTHSPTKRYTTQLKSDIVDFE